MQRYIRLSVALVCLMLAACDMDIKETLGLNRKGPDAMQVYSRPPLTVPPDYDLKAPGKGPEGVVGVPADVQAHNHILSASDPAAAPTTGALPNTGLLNVPLTGPAATAVPAVTSNALPSGGDAQFLSDVGADKADPNIRDEIEKDKLVPVKPKDTHYFWSGSSTEEPTVNPDKEAERLKDDKAQNKPPTAGDTPVNSTPDKGLLGGIF